MTGYLDAFNIALELAQRMSLLAVSAYLAMRWTWLRESLQAGAGQWERQAVAALFFGLLAMIGTHSGLVVDVAEGSVLNWRPDQGVGMQKPLAIVSFRDMVALSAGLTCGPGCGFGAGLLAGAERFCLGGFTATGAALATALLGLGAGIAKVRRPQDSQRSAGLLLTILAGTLMQKLMVVLFSSAPEDTLMLIKTTFIASTLANLAGVFLFLAVMRELERERLQTVAELRALQAQVEPHFLNNTLNAIKTMIRLDPSQAAQSIVCLARFFSASRPYAMAGSITLTEEMEQLRRYLELQTLCLPEGITLDFHADVPGALGDCRVLPRSLVTLAENCFNHGLRGKTGVFRLSVIARDAGNRVELSLSDNGCGIPPERLALLGKRPVSSRTGSGTALHHLHQCLDLAYRHAARLDLHSKEGEGTRIVISLPKRTQP